MFGWWAADTVRPKIASRTDGAGRSPQGRLKEGQHHTGKAFGRTGRHEDAFVAAARHRRLRWATGHLVRSLIVRSLIVHRGCRQGMRHVCGRRRLACRGHHRRLGKRSADQSRDHESGDEPAYGIYVMHASKSHNCGTIGSFLPNDTVRGRAAGTSTCLGPSLAAQTISGRPTLRLRDKGILHSRR